MSHPTLCPPYETSRGFDSTRQESAMIQPPLGPQIEHLLKEIQRLFTLPWETRLETGLRILGQASQVNLQFRRRDDSEASLPLPGLPAAGAVFFTSEEGRRRYAEQLRIRCRILTISLPEHSFTGTFPLSEVLGPMGHMGAPMEEQRAMEVLARDLSNAHARLTPDAGPEADELEMFRRLVVVTWRETARARSLAAQEREGGAAGQ